MKYILLLLLLFIYCYSGISQTISILYDTVCVGDTTGLTAITSFTVDDTCYLWDFNNDNIFDDATGKTVKYKTNIGGNFISLKVLNGSNEYYSSKILSVYYIPSADFEIPSILCKDEMIEFINQSTAFNASINKVYWDFTNDGDIDDSINAVNTEHSYLLPGNYSARLKVVTDKGCSAEVTRNLSVLNKPDVNFSYTGHCLNDTIQFTNQSEYDTDSILSLSWQFGDGSDYNIITENIEHIYSVQGTFPVSLTVTYQNGCTDSMETSITINSLPEVNIDVLPDTLIYEGNIAELTVNGEYQDILWSTGATENNISTTQSGLFWCKVTQNGCSNTDTVNIMVYPIEQVKIKNNIMTPNDDGINDCFIIENLESYGKCSVTIFNRYGRLVFADDNYRNEWKGELNGVSGNILPAGAYYYSIKVGNYTTTGNINILR